jgi:hypothetical protein
MCSAAQANSTRGPFCKANWNFRLSDNHRISSDFSTRGTIYLSQRNAVRRDGHTLITIS